MDLNINSLKILTNFKNDSPCFPNLIQLDLSYNNFGGDSCELSKILLQLICNCPCLSALSLSYCYLNGIFDTSYSLSNFTQENTKLSNINVAGNPIDENQLKNMFNYFLPWNEYDSVCLSDLSLSYDILLPLSSFLRISKAKIYDLNISNNRCSQTFFSLISSIHFQQNIKKLDISNCNLETPFSTLLRKELPSLTSLQYLYVHDNPDLFSSADDLFDFIYSCLHCISLTYVDISNTVVLNSSDNNTQLSPSILHFNQDFNHQFKLSKLNKIILNNNGFTINTLNACMSKFNLNFYNLNIDGNLCFIER
ncbi:hypothetical protein MXB_5586 [Myxobolus squamalis]|nr:hypothetical protein MXB_5586 [Myxobolus squamalis]